MKKNLFIGLLLLFGVSVAAQVSKRQKFEEPATIPQSLNISTERLVHIDNLLQEYVDKGIIPQALTFVAKDGIVIHNKAFGWSDIESRKAVKKNDVFRIYSQTKAIVSVALLTLYEKGKFQLDDPVSNYIPECTEVVLEKLNEDGTYTTRAASTPLTIRHLMSHTSGILGNKDLYKIYGEMKNKRDNKPYETLAEYVKDLVQLPLIFDPGTQFNYHPSTDVCGYLVEYFSGKPLREYVKETVLDPLGMVDSDWYYPESYRERFVTAYVEKDGKLVAQHNLWNNQDPLWSGLDPFSTDVRFCQAGLGLNGTIADYARFCQMILNGGTFNDVRILGRRTINMLYDDQLPHPNSFGADFHFGLATEINPLNPKERKGVANFTPMIPAGALQWGGMYNTDYLIDPTENMIVLLYTNRVPDTMIWEKYINTVYQILE